MSNPNLDLLAAFYAAFKRRDGVAMSACYHPDARFRDPMFDLAGAEVGAMWRMLCSRGTDVRIEYANLEADDTRGRADWQAWYTFSTTERKVHNIVHSDFLFRDGLIVEQNDTFAIWRWSRQALGLTGTLLGWSPFLHRKLRGTARTALDRYIAAEATSR